MSQTSFSEISEKMQKVNDTLYMGGLAKRVIEEMGKYDGKYATTVSLSTHSLNVLSLSVNKFLFDELYYTGSLPDKDEIGVLSAACVLHDLNKYLTASSEGEYYNNKESFEEYLENDTLDLELFFEDLGLSFEEYTEDIFYLIQHTEAGQNGIESKGEIRSKYSQLPKYCEFGDKVASKMSVEGFKDGSNYVSQQYPDLYHEISLNSIEYPIMNQLLLNSIKETIEKENYGIVLGSTNENILYLGKSIELAEIEDSVTSRLEKSIVQIFQFNSKAAWNTFEYKSLVSIPLSEDKKREIISSDWEDLLKRDSGRESGLDSINSDVKEWLPELGKMIFDPDDGSTEAPTTDELKQLYINLGLQSIYQTAEEKSSSHSFNVNLLHETVKSYPQNKKAVEELANTYRSKVSKDLSASTDVFSDLYRKITGVYLADKEINIPSSGDSCFLCGSSADRSYKPGNNAIFSGRSFSRRTKPHQTEKKICSICQIESALLDGFIKGSDSYISTFNGSILYVYTDNFVPDVKLDFSWKNRTLGGEVVNLNKKDADWNLNRYAGINQFEMVPLHFDGSNDRIQTIKYVLTFLHDTGVKGKISRPFNRFDPQNSVFTDTDPIRIEKTLGLNEITDYRSLEKYIDLFKVIELMDVDYDRKYIQVKRDEYIHLTSQVVRNIDINLQHKDLSPLVNYVSTNHGDEHMKMKTIAEAGIELYGQSYDSKHSQTQVFREALEHIVDCLSGDYSREETIEHVSGQVFSLAERQDYAGVVKTAEAEKFTELIVEYLEEKNMLSLQNLSDNLNNLVDSYYFVYQQVLEEI